MANSENVLTKLQDLLLYVVPFLSRFPREHKFTLGDRIQGKLLDVQEQCLRAYYSRDKRTHLLEANLLLEITRHLVRLAHGLRLLSNHTYGVLAEKMDEVGRMIGGWLKADAGRTGARTFLSAPVGLCRRNVGDARRRLRWNVRQYQRGDLSQQALACRWHSWVGHALQADAWPLVETVRKELIHALGTTGN